jgi:hypothetical protein
MNEAFLTAADAVWKPPIPLLFKTLKHHLRYLQWRSAGCSCGNHEALTSLASETAALGTGLWDLYTGELTPLDVSLALLQQLEHAAVLDSRHYRQWLDAADGFRIVTLPEDSSQWVLRWSDGVGRYIHVHPARGSPHSRRVRGTVLKTAALTAAHVRYSSNTPLDVTLINQLRKAYLDLPPIGQLERDHGLAEVLAILSR